MKKLMMFLMLLSISVFSMGCTPPEDKPAETGTEETDAGTEEAGSEEAGTEEEGDDHDHAGGEGHEEDDDKGGDE